MRKYYFEILLVSTLSLIYGLTIPSAVPLGDSGEFISAACTWGIAHPPGFPLYVFLGKFFCSLPFSTPAFRVNMMSSFFGIAACLFFYLALLELKVSRWVAFGSALMLGLSKTFWSQSVVAEVYTLNVFFVSVIHYFLTRLRQNPSPKLFYWVCFLTGLSLTNHWPFMALTIIPWLLYLLSVSTIRSIFFRNFFRGFFFFLLPLLLYVYLPWRSLQNPYIDWGNPENWHNFWHHLLRTTTSEKSLDAEGISHLKWLFFVLKEMGRDFLWVGPLVALVGFFRGPSESKTERLLCLAQIVLFIGVIVFWMSLPFSRLSLKTIQINFLPAYFFMMLLTGLGWNILLKNLKDPIVLLPIPFLLFFHFRVLDPKPNKIVEEWGRQFLHSLNEGATVFTALDIDSFVLSYLHGVQNIRPDVTLISEGSNMIRPKFLSNVLDSDLQQLYNAQLKREALEGKRKVYFASKYRTRGDPRRVVSTGIGYQLGGSKPFCDKNPPVINPQTLLENLRPYLEFDPWYVMFAQFVREPLGDYYLEKLDRCHLEKKGEEFKILQGKIVQLAEKDPLLLNKLAWELFWLGQPEEEISKWLETSLEVSQKNRMMEVVDVHLLKNILAARRKNWEKALQGMKKTLAKNPVHYAALIYAANLDNHLGLVEESKRLLNRLEAIYPSWLLPQDILDLLRRGEAFPFDVSWLQRIQWSAPPPMKAAQ